MRLLLWRQERIRGDAIRQVLAFDLDAPDDVPELYLPVNPKDDPASIVLEPMPNSPVRVKETFWRISKIDFVKEPA